VHQSWSHATGADHFADDWLQADIEEVQPVLEVHQDPLGDQPDRPRMLPLVAVGMSLLFAGMVAPDVRSLMGGGQ
jgi:hypothetical protein